MRILLLAALLGCATTAQGEETAPLPITAAFGSKDFACELSGNGRDLVTIKLTNHTATPAAFQVPAGLIVAGDDKEKQLLLRAVRVDVSANDQTEAIIPAAALSSKNGSVLREVKLATDTEPRLEKLLPLFEKQNDLPRPTAQLAVFVMLEDLPLPKWMQWLAQSRPNPKAPQPNPTAPTPEEVAQIIDALAFTHLAAPERKFTLLADEDLKRLALRNQWARGKAMVLYGLTVDDALTGEPALAPSLNQLLHTAPNDNCPICKQRAKMQQDNGL